jgi:hypothetical protein
MKKILLLCFLPSLAFGQYFEFAPLKYFNVPKVPQYVNTWYNFWGVNADSVNKVPRVAPQQRYRDSGQVFMDVQDSSLRVTTSTNNIKVGPAILPVHNSLGVGTDYNPSFLVDVYGIPAVVNGYVAGDTIKWGWLDSSAGHGYGFVTSISSDPATHRLLLNYPNVRRVLSTILAPDESFSTFGVVTGCSTGFGQAVCPLTNAAVVGLLLVGSNTANWSKAGLFNPNWAVSSYNTANGQTLLNLAPGSGGTYNYDPNSTSITYEGANNYGILRNFSALGSYTIGFQLINEVTGLPVTTAPTGSDVVVVSGAAIGPQFVDAHTYNSTNTYFSESFNFWFRGIFEAWMVCDQVDSSTIEVKYQTNYPSATVYKIYRGTSPVFSSQMLVHTGTTGSYLDTGLAANTKYYYTEIATVSSVDTQVTTFISSTFNKY